MAAIWKFEPPYLARTTLRRTRLTERIERGVGKNGRSGSVFLISAPAGYGKTTALAQWANDTALPVVWLHLDASDNDPAILITDICAALRPVGARSALWRAAALFTRQRRADGVISAAELRRAVDLLIRDVQASIKHPVALIITGIAELQASSQARLAVELLLTRPAADHLRMVLEFREFPGNLRLAPLLPQQRLDGIGLEELRFTDHEFESLLDELGFPPAHPNRDQLNRLCAGWVTGLLLATGALWPAFLTRHFSGSLLGLEQLDTVTDEPVQLNASSSLLTDVNRKAVFDYLTNEVIDGLPAHLYDFAVRASILTALSAPLCAQLFHEPRANTYLTELEQRTGLLTGLGHPLGALRYSIQPFLREALLSRLHQEASPAQIQDLHVKAGRLLENQGDYEEALNHYVAAQQFHFAVSLLVSRSPVLMRSGCGVTVRRWLEKLPEEVRYAHTALLCIEATLLRQAGELDAALQVTQRVGALPEAQHPTPSESRQVAWLHCVRAQIHVSQGAYQEARHECEQALQLVPNDVEVQVQASFSLAACLKYLETPQRAEACLAQVAHLVTSSELWLQARHLYFRSQLAMASGSIAASDELATRALRIAQEADDEIIAISAHIQLGATKQSLGDLRLAGHHLELAASMSEAAAYSIGQVYALVNSADLALAMQDYQRACSFYEQVIALGLGASDRRVRDHAYTEYCLALTLMGDAKRAQATLTPIVQEYEARDGDCRDATWTAVAILSGFIAGRLEHDEEAARWFDRADKHALQHQASAIFARSRLFRAAIQQRQNLRSARETLQQIIDYLLAEGVDVQALVEIKHFPQLLSVLADLYPVGSDVLRLIGQENFSLQTTAGLQISTRPPALPAELRVYLLGSPRILLGDVEVEFWRKPQARDLLCYLIDQGRATHKERILEALWPSRDPDQADRAFTKARYYLRLLLHRDCLQHEKECWRLTVSATPDTERFEHDVAAGQSLLAERKLTEAAQMFRQAIDRYGEFMEGSFDDWVVLRRHILRRQFLECVETCARLELRLRRLDQSAALFHQLIDIDPAHELAHRGLMAIYLRRGETTQAHHQYERCRTALLAEGMAPSPETIAMLNHIPASSTPARNMAKVANQ